jgi:hypothetical protein
LFDTDITQTNGEASYIGSKFWTGGKDFGASSRKRITGYKTWCSSNYGCNDLNPPNTTFISRLYVSNTGLNLDRVLLYTNSFTDVNSAQEKDLTNVGVDSNDTYRYVWVEFESGSNNIYGVAEIEFYSSDLSCIS